MHSKDNLPTPPECHVPEQIHSPARSAHSHDQALIVFHNLNMLLCIINQQMTTILSLQNSLRDHPKHLYRHNDQLEELRNLQDKLQDEKNAWQKQKEAQEKAMDERQRQQDAALEQIRIEQEDIKQQREQLFRKMEKMEKLASQQCLTLSPNAANPIFATMNNVEDSHHSNNGQDEQTVFDGAVHSLRRKEKWSTSTSK